TRRRRLRPHVGLAITRGLPCPRHRGGAPTSSEPWAAQAHAGAPTTRPLARNLSHTNNAADPTCSPPWRTMRARSLLLRLSLSLLASALAACGDPGAECSITTGDDGRTSLVCSDGTSYSFPEPASPDDDTCHITARHDDGSVTLTCGEEEFVVGGPEDCRLEARRYSLREEPFAEALVARCADGTEQVVRVEVYAPTETPTARDAVAVSSNRSCFLSRHGAATCWGAEGDGE